MPKNNNDPTKILTYRDFVPDHFRFWGAILIALVYFFSGAGQLASSGQQVSSWSLLHEDTQMIGYSAFIGMNMIFPILFPIRFRFSTKTILMVVTVILIICHFCTLQTKNVPLLCLINFIAGSFRMIGSFELMVIIQLTITPIRSYAMFYSVIFFIVQGSAIFFGTQIAYIMDYLSIRHLHWIIILLLMWVLLSVYLFFRHYRSMKKIPLYGIDWAGYGLWSISLFLVLFIITYGKYYEWFSSKHIRLAAISLVVIFILNIYHMNRIKRPYISLEAWKYKNLWKLVLLFLVLYITLATPNALQNSYMSQILDFDPIHIVLLNWFVLGGMCASGLLCYYWFVRHNNRIKPMIFIGYLCVVLYLFLIYFNIDLHTDIECFYVPAFLRGFGLLLLYIVLTLYVANIVPFKHNFQVLCIIGFIRMSLGTVTGYSIIDNLMHYLNVKNSTILSYELDQVNPIVNNLGINYIVNELNKQVILVSMKEIYGWLAIFGMAVLFIILFEKNLSNFNQYYPKMKTIRHLLKRKVDKDIREKKD